MTPRARGLLAALPLALLAHSAPAQDAQEAPLNVVATVGMVGDVAREVGGDCVEVTVIMGPGTDPHLYRASAGDVRTFQSADVILYSGYALEGQLGDVLGRLAEIRPTVAVAPASIAPADLIAVQDLYGTDPHLWMDVALWAQTVPTLAEALGELRPDCAEEMAANAERYGRELEALDGWVEEAIASIPAGQRVLVTAHDAFGYYGRAYGIEVTGIQGISTESEAGIADIRDMARIAAERSVPAVFIESTINPRTIQAVIDAARRQGHEMEVGGELFSDAMGEAGTPGGTYIGMLHENTVTITQALGGTVPPLPETLGRWADTWNVETASAAGEGR